MTPSLTQAAQQVTTGLARHIPYEAAAAWVHSGALVQHAAGLGLIDRRGSVLDTLKALADAHPALTGLADPDVNRALTTRVPDLDPVDDLWSHHSVADAPARPDGYLLGDLYQALSEESRKGRALCQTPRFVTDLLWDLTVPDAVQEFGPELKLIDPSCGTGHILIEAAIRMYSVVSSHDRLPFDHRRERALAAVHGVDLDPYAVAVARYRLLALFCRSDGKQLRADQAPKDLPINVACADSLLDETEPLLERGRYHIVLANPPYITPKDARLNEAIRRRYPEVCHRKYSLALPFVQLMTELLVPGGWCAQLTTNSFMKREFGQKFCEQYLPRYDLQWIIDTSGAYIPGHGTPTAILMHRNQPPSGDTITIISGIKGEPRVPEDPARGAVWSEIARLVDQKLSYRRFAAAARNAADVHAAGADPAGAIASDTDDHVADGHRYGMLYDCPGCEATCYCAGDLRCVRCAVNAEKRRTAPVRTRPAPARRAAPAGYRQPSLLDLIPS